MKQETMALVNNKDAALVFIKKSNVPFEKTFLPHDASHAIFHNTTRPDDEVWQNIMDTLRLLPNGRTYDAYTRDNIVATMQSRLSPQWTPQQILAKYDKQIALLEEAKKQWGNIPKDPKAFLELPVLASTAKWLLDIKC